MSFFASIIPFEHSIGVTPLLYSGWDIAISELQIGQIVEIPYGNKVEHGIVAEIYTECPIDEMSEAYMRIKAMNRIVTDKIFLAPYQIDMITRISARFMIPIHRVLAILLTRPILTRLERKNYEQIENKETIVQKKWHGHIHIVQDNIVTPALVDTYTQSWPTVVILPDDYAMMPYREYYGDRADVLFVSGDMTDIRRAQAWIDIANGKYSIIYWTRRIIYYNLEQYQNIVYVEDALGPDYWHYPIRISYSDILHIFATVNPDRDLTILTSVVTLATLTHLRHYPIHNIQTA